MMDRRTFVCFAAAGFVATPLAVRGQAATKMRRVGFLSYDVTADLKELLAPLRERGWIEGKNIVVERRLTDLLPAAAQELVRLNVELIIADGTEATLAAKNATTSIPIVMLGAGDPVGMGIVESLARPGGNVTGYSGVALNIGAKRAALVHELLPKAQRVALLTGWMGIGQLMIEASEAAYRSLGVTPVLIQRAEDLKGLERVLAEAVRLGVQAVEMDPVDLPADDVTAIMTIAMRYRLPVIVNSKDLLAAGALMSFSSDPNDQLRRVALIIDKILRGAKPADIPVEQPTRFELGINQKVAKALGIEVPQSLLVRANEVIR